MKRTLLALAIILATLAPRAASAQVSIWLQRGVSGYGGALSFATNSNAQIFGLSGGYSYQGWLELDLGVDYVSFSKSVFAGASVSAVGLTPTVQFHPIKQSAEMPVSVGFSANVAKLWYSSSDFTSGSGISETDVGGSVSVYRFFKLTSNIGVIPAAAFDVTHSWTTITSMGSDISGEATNEALALGGYFAYIDDAGRIWGLVPSVTFGFGDGDSTTTFGIELGLIMSQQ